MFSRLRSLIATITVIAVASLGTNAFLGWQWQKERQNFQNLLSNKTQQLTTTGLKNRKLSRENKGFQTELQTKDQELAQKISDLAKKQDELNTLSTQFDAKKKEVDEKALELDTKIKDLAKAQKEINDQKSQLAANSSELSKLRDRPPLFSFQVKSSSLQDVEAKKAAVKQIVTDAYDVIQLLFGKPYLLHSVSITFVEKFENDKASGEIVITNSASGLDYDIHIKDFNSKSFNDINVIIHEVVHSFHGLSSLEPTAFEEGIAVAITDAVMKKMVASGTIPPFSSLYIQLSEAEFTSQQASLTIPREYAAFYGSDKVADFYQVLGKAWYNLYLADSEFFKKFNEKIYAQKNNGQSVTEKMVLETIKEVQPNANLTGAAWNLK